MLSSVCGRKVFFDLLLQFSYMVMMSQRPPDVNVPKEQTPSTPTWLRQQFADFPTGPLSGLSQEGGSAALVVCCSPHPRTRVPCPEPHVPAMHKRPRPLRAGGGVSGRPRSWLGSASSSWWFPFSSPSPDVPGSPQGARARGGRGSSGDT